MSTKRGKYLIAVAKAGELGDRWAAFSGRDRRPVIVVRADMIVGLLFEVDAMRSKGSRGLLRVFPTEGRRNLAQIAKRKSMVWRTNSEFASTLASTL